MIKITFNVNSALLNNYVAHIFRNLNMLLQILPGSLLTIIATLFQTLLF